MDGVDHTPSNRGCINYVNSVRKVSSKTVRQDLRRNSKRERRTETGGVSGARPLWLIEKPPSRRAVTF